MRILHLLSQLELTGAESYAITLAERQIECGHRVFVVSDTLNMNTQAKFLRLKFNKRGLLDRYNHIRFLTDFIRREKVDVVHSHSRASSWSGHISSRLCGTPHFTSVHQILPGGLSKRFLPCLGDVSFAICENAKKAIIENYGFPPYRIKVIRNAVDLNRFIIRELPGGELNIAIVGRYSGPKGRVLIWYLREVISKVDEKVKPFNLLIVGRQVDEIVREVENVSSCLRACRLKQLGFVDDIEKVYKKAAIVIGAGRVAVEAILSGRCVLALGERGFLGLVKRENLYDMERSSFGDCLFEDEFNVDFAVNETIFAIENYMDIINHKRKLVEKVKELHDAEIIEAQINDVYRRLLHKRGQQS